MMKCRVLMTSKIKTHFTKKATLTQEESRVKCPSACLRAGLSIWFSYHCRYFCWPFTPPYWQGWGIGLLHCSGSIFFLRESCFFQEGGISGTLRHNIYICWRARASGALHPAPQDAINHPQSTWPAEEGDACVLRLCGRLPCALKPHSGLTASAGEWTLGFFLLLELYIQPETSWASFSCYTIIN